jgi:hypothetical protein
MNGQKECLIKAAIEFITHVLLHWSTVKNYFEYFSTVDEYYCWTVCRDVTEAEYNKYRIMYRRTV